VFGSLEEADECEPVGLHIYLSQLGVLAATWAVAGCFDTEVGDETGSKAIFRHWCGFTCCARVLEGRAYAELPAHTENSVACGSPLSRTRCARAQSSWSAAPIGSFGVEP